MPFESEFDGGIAAANADWGTVATGGADLNDGFGGGRGDNFGVEKKVDTGFDGGIGDAGNAGGDRACFNCGETGHVKSDCPKPRVFSGACRRCNEEGHWSKDCPNAPPMQCRECESTEHLAKDCPNRVCKNCGETGHTVSKCDRPRKIDYSEIPDMTTEEAWALIEKAAKERDIDDAKFAIKAYSKSSPDTTYEELEKAFRAQDIPLWLIAIEKQLAVTLTNMDLQGHLGKKYTVTYRLQWNPPRPRERDLWPKDEAENLERLKDAGEPVPGGLPKCRNCDELGHVAKSCPKDKVEQTIVEVLCYNCGEKNHRVRDCPVPRVDKFACKNCGKSGHKVADCPEPPNTDNVECRKCGEMGHFSRDCSQGGGSRGCRNCGQEGHMAKECTEPRNMDAVQCRNCDEYGHMSKECPKPRDYSRVKCSNCQQMGHTKVRCPNPLVSEDTGDAGFGGGGGGGDWGPTPAATGDWESTPATGGGW